MRMAFQTKAKTIWDGIRHCILFNRWDSLASFLYSFIPDREWDRFLSLVRVFCPFVNLEVGK